MKLRKLHWAQLKQDLDITDCGTIPAGTVVEAIKLYDGNRHRYYPQIRILGTKKRIAFKRARYSYLLEPLE